MNKNKYKNLLKRYLSLKPENEPKPVVEKIEPKPVVEKKIEPKPVVEK